MNAKRNARQSKTVQLTLDQRTFRTLESLAAAQKCSVEKYLEDMVYRLAPTDDPILGLFHDAPELMDQVVEGAMKDREKRYRRE